MNKISRVIPSGNRFKICSENGCGRPASAVVEIEGGFRYLCELHEKELCGYETSKEGDESYD